MQIRTLLAFSLAIVTVTSVPTLQPRANDVAAIAEVNNALSVRTPATLIEREAQGNLPNPLESTILILLTSQIIVLISSIIAFLTPLAGQIITVPGPLVAQLIDFLRTRANQLLLIAPDLAKQAIDLATQLASQNSQAGLPADTLRQVVVVVRELVAVTQQGGAGGMSVGFARQVLAVLAGLLAAVSVGR